MRLNEEGENVPDPLYEMLHLGTVTDRNDPEGLGRVRLLIPGVYLVPSPWAWPLGTLGGGSPQRGGFFIPEVGATVGVFFILGNYERPAYITGHWGKPGGTSEAPTPLSGLDPSVVPDVRAIETKNFLIVLDDRSGNESLTIKDKNNATGIVTLKQGKVYIADPAASHPFVLGDSWKSIEHAVLQALATHTHPTAVGPSGPPVNAAVFTNQDAQVDSAVSSVIFGK